MIKKRKSITKLKKEAWKLFSAWVRSHKADFAGYVECYTCYKMIPWKEANAGHYRHDSHDFDDRNVKVQCVGCNLSDKGRADQFYLHLIKDYGIEVADELRTRPKWNNYSRLELEDLITKYKEAS